MTSSSRPTALLPALIIFWAWPTAAHGPVFSAAPETIFKGGTEVTLGYHFERASGAGGSEIEHEPFVEIDYGITSDFQVSAEFPYRFKEENDASANGLGDVIVGAKFEFWHLDLPGEQYKAAGLFRLKLPTGDDDGTPRVGSGSTDVIGGLATGYEGRRWYWFASGLYRLNTEGSGLEKGDRQFLNLVGGVRPVLTEYHQPDTVLMLELNWERAGRDSLNGVGIANSGGWELFLSPVLWWTYRQTAIRGGVQIPIAENLNGRQPTADYRGKIEWVYHF